MRPTIESAIGAPIAAVFAEFDRRPVAAASLAQVYRARLHDGRPVAVKVLYPGIERLVRSDLRVLRFVLWLDSRVGGYPLEPVYNELATNVPLEVDLVHEAAAMEAMAARLAADPDIVIPAVVHEHTSKTVLVMEWIDGIKITEVERLRRAGNDVQRLADLMLDCYARQMLVNGFFHADPHPGNLFALPGNRLAIVDFGLTKRLTPAFRRSLAKLLLAMTTADLPLMIEAFGELGFAVKRGEDHAVWLATGEFFRRITDPKTYGTTPESMMSLNEEWARAVKANPFIAIPGDFTLVSRVFSLITGVSTAMGAEPHVVETVLRYTAGIGAPQPAAAGAGSGG
jgi:predicted unusual protein kinase regulating ubiquinone biosynthesis (AarF/ABC1/UbiB family)